MALNITERDIADAVGISQPAVSRVLSGKPSSIRVSAKTRDRILAIAHQAGFRPSRIARDMALRRQTSIGLILAAGGPDVPVSTLASMESVIVAAGYRLLLAILPTDPVSARDRLAALLHDGVAGLLCGATALPLASQVVAGACPVVAVGSGAGEALFKLLGVNVEIKAPPPPAKPPPPVAAAVPSEAPTPVPVVAPAPVSRPVPVLEPASVLPEPEPVVSVSVISQSSGSTPASEPIATPEPTISQTAEPDVVPEVTPVESIPAETVTPVQPVSEAGTTSEPAVIPTGQEEGAEQGEASGETMPVPPVADPPAEEIDSISEPDVASVVVPEERPVESGPEQESPVVAEPVAEIAIPEPVAMEPTPVTPTPEPTPVIPEPEPVQPPAVVAPVPEPEPPVTGPVIVEPPPVAPAPAPVAVPEPVTQKTPAPIALPDPIPVAPAPGSPTPPPSPAPVPQAPPEAQVGEGLTPAEDRPSVDPATEGELAADEQTEGTSLQV